MRYRELMERIERVEINPLYAPSQVIPVAVNPNKAQIIGFQNRYCADDAFMQLRGLALKDKWLVWAAKDSTHHYVAEALGREGEFDDTDTPGEHCFFVEIGEKVIFIGNPEFCSHYIPRFAQVFDCIDLPSGEWTDYEDSEWGIPCRGTDRPFG